MESNDLEREKTMKIISIVFLCLCVFYFVVSYWIFRKKKNEKRKSENEDLVWIDTSDAAEHFATLLNNNLTFFLNGEWGAGKTEYLKNVEKNARKKFIYVNLWNMKDERSVISIGFSALHNWMNHIYRIILIGCVVVSILLTPAINIGLGKFISHFLGDSMINFIIPVASIVSLFVAVWQFFKYKSDDVYYRVFQWPISEYFLRKKYL
ncbi:P-loop NTPase fold protein [Enterococcus faecium]|uniref:P-loop NTPase fold protein n=1 Tax=Enterococcus faecium TaxID=1352 RepID=UPI0023B26FB6|nr:P-loop NTPase fold protein [Enterococcus faecium]